MAYTPPPLHEQVILHERGEYVPPPLSQQVILAPAGAGPEYTGTGHAVSSPIVTPAQVRALVRPVLSARGAAQAAPIVTPAAASGQGGLWGAAGHVQTSPVVVPATAYASGVTILSAHGHASAAPLAPGASPAAFAALVLRAVASAQSAPVIPAAAARSSAGVVLAGAARASAAAIVAPAHPSGSATQYLDLPDNAATRAGLPHRPGRPVAATRLGAPHAAAIRARLRVRAPHAEAIPVPARASLRHAAALTTRRPVRLRHAGATPIHTRVALRHAEALRTRRPVRLRHAQAIPVSTRAALRHAERLLRRPRAALRHAEAIPVPRRLALGHHRAPPTAAIRLWTRWAQGIYPPPGCWWPKYEPPPLRQVILRSRGSYVPRPLRCQVLLGAFTPSQPPCPIDPPGPGGPIVIPVQRTYTVINTFSLVTVEGGHEVVPTSTFTAALDAESWAWTWSTTVHAGNLPLLRPDADGPVELLATLNGQALRLRVERLARERRFGRADLRISGRSRSAELAAPWVPEITRTNAAERTAHQLMDDVLTDNGVPIGWDLDWQIQDWLVPAGVWNHTGAYMDAIVRIAQAAGAYVQPHDTAPTLRILPRYPAAPWDWPAMSADIVLPEDVVTVEGIEWSDQSPYDAVYLAGTGILGHVVRAGRSGGTVAPMVTDELLTHSDATLQRGRAILSDTGRQARIQLKLPVLPATGIINPGLLLDYAEQGVTHRGLTRGVSLAVDFPRITQTVEIETHEPA